ncbi:MULTISPECIES: hypothetical protein [unclassified Mucilaginibacter]|uniref:hypothetical protein n=1 Tax=unclassified Mucilaginibacter TaxID=2617802 RepID=UPI002AC8CC6C|nr:MULTISPECIES: hypothetical protein [unclassified Mucilaginibacter]MEB0260756.1 hypothetical protein [Mucilaginibacter sp. 10I4]MEB0302871.1 hypothetical protein [Mucilaginibacter sp. 5C4]WPX22139.1 hypothetical protein RHM67_12690 [Mucilaginibacter sp. 5C4]
MENLLISQTLTIEITVDNGTVDFNLYNVPKDVCLPLANALKWDYQKKLGASCEKDFRLGRALQHDRNIEHCEKNGITPKQIFLDFPID